MGAFLKAFLLLSLTLNIFLIYRMVIHKKGINRITSNITDICKSGFSGRLHIGCRYNPLEELSTELNKLMDRFQNIIEEKQKLEISQKQLISNISHDIRTPLTSLLGFVEVLQENDAISRQEQKDYFNIIHAKGQSLYKMIQELFELSKLESGDTVIQMEKIDLADKVREVVAAFYQDFLMSKITPEIKLPEAPVYVYGDQTGVERVLHNIVSNALKYGKDGGIIGVSVRDEAEKVWVDVWDNGKGIPENDLPFLFNRLYTAETSRNEKLRGSGLGLAIAKQLVEKQNGEIHVTSVPGKKTVLSFYLLKF